MSFSVVLNSLYNYEEVGTGVADIIYQYDFTNMEQGTYEVSFSYRGEQNHLDSTDLCLVYVDFGAFRDVYEANDTTQNKYSKFIGFLHNQYNTNTDGYLYANLNDNPPFELKFKPSGNEIRITLKKPNGTIFTTHGAQTPAEYIMTLHFKKI